MLHRNLTRPYAMESTCDSQYRPWCPYVWEPTCGPPLPRFSASGFCSALRGRRILFVGDHDMTLRASSLPQNAFGFFIVSDTQGFTANPGGSQGDLCLGGSTPGMGRYVQDLQAPGGSGTYSVDIYNGNTGGGSGSLPGPPGGSLMPGDTWNFQAWNRQPSPDPSDFTKALSVTFQ